MSVNLPCFELVTVAIPVSLALAFAIYITLMKSPNYAAGVVTNGYECSEIGARMLQKGGSAVDAAIAALFCEGIAMPHAMGIGGGFFMIIYQKKTKKAYFLNSREVAPAAATKDMFQGNFSLSTVGGLSIAIPGEVKGYWQAHKKFGKLPWAELVQPSIDLCRKGHLVTKSFETFLKQEKAEIFQYEPLREMFVNPRTNSTWKKGDLMKNPLLAETLEAIAVDGPEALYDGCLTKSLVNDIQSAGGIITEQDLKKYTPIWKPPASINLNGWSMYTSGLPGGGAILCFLLSVINKTLDVRSGLSSIKNWHRIVETFKFIYARRTEVGDPDFVKGMDKLLANLTNNEYAKNTAEKICDTQTFNDPEHYGINFKPNEDFGTANVCVYSENGDAVVTTSTINMNFGSKVYSYSTGILLNNQMDDFASPGITNAYNLPPTPNNFISPGKRPTSSMAPTLFVDCKGNARLLAGASGGSKIPTALALVIMRHLWFSTPIQDAIAAARVHHQLLPNNIIFEEAVNKDIINGLAKLGHKYIVSKADGFSSVTAISVDNKGRVSGSPDPRRGGGVSLLVSTK